MCIQSIQIDSSFSSSSKKTVSKSNSGSLNSNTTKNSNSNNNNNTRLDAATNGKNKKTPLLDNAQLDQMESDHE